MSESILKQLVADSKATIICVYGLPRSGTTIAQIILAQFAHRAFHEPFTGLLQNQLSHSRVKKWQIDEEIYEAGCNLITEHILEILTHNHHAVVLVKEVSSFFSSALWARWSQIAHKFLLTIRDPHLQYWSRLSQITNLAFKSPDSQGKSYPFILEKTPLIESLELQSLKPFWHGQITDYNEESWKTFHHHLNLVRTNLQAPTKKLAILDSVLLRYNSPYTIARIIEQLALDVTEFEQPTPHCLVDAQTKIFDLRDPRRHTVSKARNSQGILPLVLGEDISPYALPVNSRKHIWRLIPLYLDLLYAPEQRAMPSLAQLDTSMAPSPTWKLEATNPFVAYAIASFYFHCQTTSHSRIDSLIQRILKGQTRGLSPTTESCANSARFQGSFAAVNQYWHTRQRANFCGQIFQDDQL